MSEPPIRLLVHGASGRMGRALLRLAAADSRFSLVAAVSQAGVGMPEQDASVTCLAATELAKAPLFDIAIDFSLPGAVAPLVDLCASRGAGLVSGTTGLSEAQLDAVRAGASRAPMLWASNFSLGVAVMEDLVRRAALARGRWDLRITETHHVHKQDAPSGTALTLAQAGAGARGAMPCIESIRKGEVVGDHLVRFSGPGETLELLHRAGDRDIFALGALEAAALLVGRAPGMYRLGDLLFIAG